MSAYTYQNHTKRQASLQSTGCRDEIVRKSEKISLGNQEKKKKAETIIDIALVRQTRYTQ